jgi:hypothetical protein
VPAGLIHEQDGMGALRDGLRDLGRLSVNLVINLMREAQPTHLILHLCKNPHRA